MQKQKLSQKNKWEKGNNGGGSSKNHSLRVRKRETKLLSIDRRHRHYYNQMNQMKIVVSSFEAVAGNETVIAYSALALYER